jgi:hypothetical protein
MNYNFSCNQYNFLRFSVMQSPNGIFSEASSLWDLQTIYIDMGLAKNKPLTPMEKTHLRALLCGLSPSEIADRLGKSVKGVEVDLSNTLYQYVKQLVGKAEEKVDNWRNICEWLEEAGYKSELKIDLEPETSVAYELPARLIIKKASIVLDQNQIVVNINLKITTTPEGELQIENRKPNNQGDRNGSK